MIERDRLLQFFSVDIEMGTLHWRVSRSWRAPVGSLAGTVSVYGYRVVCADQKLYHVSHIIWFLAHGRWPKEIDHKNRVRLDNRLENLREATRPQNCANAGARSTSKSGVRGVWWDKARGKWTSQIERGGVVRSLGRFDSQLDAAVAYRHAARELFGEFATENQHATAR